MGASELDRIAIEFPGATPAEAAIIAQECARGLQQAGLQADSIRIARSEQDAMDLGGVLVILGNLAVKFIMGGVEGVGKAIGEAVGRRVLEAISKRHRTPIQIKGETWTIGSEFKRAPLPTDANGAAGFGTLGIVILGASTFPDMRDATLDNAAFARSADLAKSLFSPPNTAFARTEILDLFNSEKQPLDILDAIERHIDDHPDMHDLLIYYCGHGSFHQDSTYFLLLRKTRADRAMATGFSPRALRNDLGPRLLDRRVYFVVDACFSGSFVEGLQSSALDGVVTDQLKLDMPQRGWSVLTASAKHKWAMAPQGETYTMFTGALAHVIENGTTAAGVRFNLHDLAAEARSYLARRWQHQALLPQCISPMQADGDVGRLPIFLNRQRTSAPDWHWPEERKGQELEAPEPVLGVVLPDGRGWLPKDDREAVRLYKLAADQGDAMAQYSLGRMYAEGRGGLPQDDREAVRLFKLAADQGNHHSCRAAAAFAQGDLGWMYAEGRGGLPQDDREAVRLFKLAADQGEARARYNLGRMYAEGRGGLPKDREAAHLYKLAGDGCHPLAEMRLYKLRADQGDATAQCYLGWMYAEGRGGLPKDEREAMRLYKLAADQGDAFAQQALARWAEGSDGLFQTVGRWLSR